MLWWDVVTAEQYACHTAVRDPGRGEAEFRHIALHARRPALRAA
jgi:hypothetical protein